MQYVWPTATHSRFEHCIGTWNFCQKLMDKLIKDSSLANCKITEHDKKMVSIAGLCHDIGHGPFSHVFDGKFMPVCRPELNFTHEEMGAKLLEYMVDHNNLELERSEVKFIQDLITGDYQNYDQEKWLLFDVVSNKRNSIDVDKFDYLLRDSYYCGIQK